MFQFTHPGRGATSLVKKKKLNDYKVSIHAPREGCDTANTSLTKLQEVSIHAPREGCDSQGDQSCLNGTKFQFTHPGRGATVWCKVAYYGADKQA